MSSSSSSSPLSPPVNIVQVSAEDLQREVHRQVQEAVYQASLLGQNNAPLPPPSNSRYIRPRQIDPFTGENAASTLQFLVELRRYLTLTELMNANNVVEHAGQFLTKAAGVWFSHTQKSPTPITTYDEFESRLRDHFIPYGVMKTARSNLHALKQKGSVQAYNTLFMRILMYIPDMAVEDQLEIYTRGLYPNLRIELHRKENINTLQKAMEYAAYTEQEISHHTQRSFVPSNMRTGPSFVSSSNFSSAPASSIPMDVSLLDQPSGPLFHDELHEPTNTVNALYNAAGRGPSVANRRLTSLTTEERTRLMREGRCFRCRVEGHRSAQCPKNTMDARPKNGQAQ